MRKVRKIVLIVLIFICSFVGKGVDADSINVTGDIYNQITLSDYGIKVTDGSAKHTQTVYKTAGGSPVYCAAFPKEYVPGSYSTGNCTSNNIFTKVTNDQRIVAGYIIDYFENKSGWNERKKYVYTMATLNHYFKKYLKQSISSQMSDNDGEILKAIASAQNELTKYTAKKKAANHPKLSVADDDNVMVKKGDTGMSYMSKKITVSSMRKGTYEISIKVPDNLPTTPVIWVCNTKTKAQNPSNYKNNGCNKYEKKEASFIVNNQSDSSYSFWITLNSIKNVDGSVNTSKFNVTVSVGAKGSFSYYKANLYCRGTGAQPLAKKATLSYDFSGSDSLTLKKPKVGVKEASAEIVKVDNDGNKISGAEFELYYASDKNGSSKKALSLKKSEDGTTFTFESDSSEGNYSGFVNAPYLCYKETKTPSGFVPNSDLSCVPKAQKNSVSCIGPNNTPVTGDDEKYCHGVSSCKVSQENGDVTYGEEACEQENTAEDVFPKSETVCLDDRESSNVEIDKKYCGLTEDSELNEYDYVVTNGSDITIKVQNQPISVAFSKRAITGEDEVNGAELKVCTKDTYSANNTKCEAATVMGRKLEWTSESNPTTFSGFVAGTYYLIETVPPLGYKTATTATEFTVKDDGTVTSGGKTVPDNVVIIRDELTELTISKDDIATSKEVPGAELAICVTVTTDIIDGVENESDESAEYVPGNEYSMDLDVDGNCIPASLADGSTAIWTSGEEPKKISGLPAGVYYLVEKIAPENYSTAESILFKMNEDGTLTDVNGNSLADNKIVMHDKMIDNPKTGQSQMIIVTLILFGVCALGGGTYYYMTKTAVVGGVSGIRKIRRRKIYK